MMADLPSGAVTFLFTDIEGSTRLWERDAAAMRAAVARHDALLQEAIAAHQGHVYKHVGDAVQAAFRSAVDALAAAVAAQRALVADPWPETGPLLVRMALHAGEAVPTAQGDYHQVPALNRLARLLATAHGGQVLLSQAVRELVHGALPADVETRDLGRHRLRDLIASERVTQLVVEGLPDQFPPLKSLERDPTNLPIQPNALIGREADLATVRMLLLHEDVRLVTLTGSGGTGKTRLALQVAADVLDAFGDGVFLVDLAPLADPALVLPQIATTLGVREVSGLTLHDAVVSYLDGKRVLLLLDNCEHLLAAAPLVAALLAASGGLKVLATSRAPLHLRGEREYAVPPLPLPDLARLPPLEQLAAVAAVALFVQRAQAVRPDFALSADNARAVTAVCIWLDGLPLAIELAAARVKVLPPAALLARLERRLPLLTRGARDLPARQQTLRAAIAWSHDLLEPAEQQLFRWLAVFAGGTTLAAADAVVDPTSGIDVLAGATALVDHSLLRQSEGKAGEPRFGMFETIREFALERLAASGEEDKTRDRHAAWYVQRAEQMSHMKRRSRLGNPEDVLELETEYANFWAALTWLTGAGNAALALRLSAGLGGFWNLRGHLDDGRLWLERTLADDDGTQPGVRAIALNWLSMLVGSRGDPERGIALLDEAEALARGTGDPPLIASVTVARGFAELHGRGDTAQATARGEESLALFEAAGVLWGISLARGLLAHAAHLQGQGERAEALFVQLLADFRDHGGDEYIAAQTLHSLGALAQGRGDHARAVSYYGEALIRFHALGDLGSVAWCLEGVAAAGGRDHPEQAARLFAAADTLRTAIHIPLPSPERPEYDRAVAVVRTILGDAAFEAAWRDGAVLPLETALAAANALAASQ
ncbi:MAG: hypothetical protein H0V00_02745 [Chloroflexia bacterium]|nr:hypothetical protein [Chloroflexia bacterium]